MFQLIHNSNREVSRAMSIPHSAFRTPHSRHRRSGISIIEVMTAVVVAMIGVFGTLVLIPFAVRQAQSGLDLDDGRNLAVNSVASFDAMGFDDHDRWVLGLAVTDASSGNPPTVQTVDRLPSVPLMIDPLWTNANGIEANVGASANPNILNNFGYLGDGVLADDPDGVSILSRSRVSDNFTLPTTYPLYGQVHPVLPSALRIRRLSLTNGASNSAASALMTPALARSLFQSTDALNFSKFGVEEVAADGLPLGGRPFQIFDRDAAGNILSRQSTGGRLSHAMFIIPGAGQESGVYRRATLVFSDRDFTLYSNPGVGRTFENANPRAIMASAMVTTRGAIPADLPSGFEGGEIVICPVEWVGGGGDPMPNQMFTDVVGTPEAPGVRRDDWVMMINQLPANYPVGGVGLGNRQQIQFYRVANIDEGNADGGTPNDLPSLTLDGPAFDFGPETTRIQTYVIHLRGVVSVYEDAISL